MNYKNLLNTYSVPGIMVGIGNTVASRNRARSCPCGAYGLVRERQVKRTFLKKHPLAWYVTEKSQTKAVDGRLRQRVF